MNSELVEFSEWLLTRVGLRMGQAARELLADAACYTEDLGCGALGTSLSRWRSCTALG